MKIFQECLRDSEKRTIFLDIDDVVLESSSAVIDILNVKRVENGLRPKTRQQNYKDFDFRGIYRGKDINIGEIFDSDEFFNRVSFNEKLIDAFKKNNNYLFNTFNWVLVTKGSNINLEKKYNFIFNHPFFKEYKNKISYYGLSMKEDKSKVFMLGGIQIDDSYFNLINTDAEIKILIKNDVDTDFNMIHKIKHNLENLYVVNNTQELIIILNYIRDIELLGGDFLYNL